MIGENDSIPPPPYKVVLLGESSVGKTSLAHRFTTNLFDLHTANTIGAAFITKIYTSNTNPERKVKFEIWDTAGQERYRSLTPMYYRNAKIALICLDLHNFEPTFATAKYWIQQLELNNTGSTEDIMIHLVGTKLDLLRKENDDENDVHTHHQLSEEEISDKLHEYHLNNASNIKQIHMTSSKDGTGINELFEQIVENIDEEFFTSYYASIGTDRAAGGGGQIGSILSGRGVAESKCC